MHARSRHALVCGHSTPLRAQLWDLRYGCCLAGRTVRHRRRTLQQHPPALPTSLQGRSAPPTSDHNVHCPAASRSGGHSCGVHSHASGAVALERTRNSPIEAVQTSFEMNRAVRNTCTCLPVRSCVLLRAPASVTALSAGHLCLAALSVGLCSCFSHLW